jgi:hypothetical protein
MNSADVLPKLESRDFIFLLLTHKCDANDRVIRSDIQTLHISALSTYPIYKPLSTYFLLYIPLYSRQPFCAPSDLLSTLLYPQKADVNTCSHWALLSYGSLLDTRNKDRREARIVIPRILPTGLHTYDLGYGHCQASSESASHKSVALPVLPLQEQGGRNREVLALRSC